MFPVIQGGAGPTTLGGRAEDQINGSRGTVGIEREGEEEPASSDANLKLSSRERAERRVKGVESFRARQGEN